MDRKARFNLTYLIAAVMGVLMIQSFLSTYGHMKSVPYSEFQQLLRDGLISEVAIGSDSVQGTLKQSTESRPEHVIATRVDPNMIAQFENAGVRYYAVRENTFLRSLISWVMPVLVFFGLWMLVFRRMAERQGMGR
jgi:cell division protease FtsH